MKPSSCQSHGKNTPKRFLSLLPGFSLVEVLVSMVILSMILLVITSVIGKTQQAWKSTTATLSQFREARQAFETVSRELRQTTIKTWVDYNGFGAVIGSQPSEPTKRGVGGLRLGQANSIVTGLGSASELPGSGVVFQVPGGLTQSAASVFQPLKWSMCKRAYFVRFSDDSSYLPAGLVDRLPARFRYRLIEFSPPTEENDLFGTGGSGNAGAPWMQVSSSAANSTATAGGQPVSRLRVVADNIIAMVMAASPRRAAIGGTVTNLAQSRNPFLQYTFDSAAPQMVNGFNMNQSTPGLIRLIMVAVDDESAARMIVGNSSPDILNRAGAGFTAPANIESDLNTLREYLAAQRYNFRIFTSDVYLPGNQI
jgi:uncharacterized protein (TIGR02599 family)